MRLTQISIENFGIYQGVNTFNFPYEPQKKVSLIIGENGAGKTTFLNAVKTCFFGSMILRSRSNTTNYENFIRSKLNINALNDSASKYSIEITFVSNLHNFDGCYKIRREWTVSSEHVNETVTLECNSALVSAQKQAEFFNALFHAYPLDLFDLFYLDGEKIDQLSVLNTNLIDMVESSINIDLFKTLKDDLTTYAISHGQDKNSNNLNEIKELKLKEMANTNQTLDNLIIKRNIYEVQIDETRENLKQLKNALHLTVVKKNDLQLIEIKNSLTEAKRDAQNLLINQLPYLFLKESLKKILSQISLEESSQKSQTIQNALNQDLESYLTQKLGYQNNDTIQVTFDLIKEYYNNDNKTFIHQLNDADFYNLKSRITNLIDSDQSQINEKIKSLRSLQTQVEKHTKELENYEIAEKAGYLNELLELQKQLSTEEAVLIDLDQDIKDILNNLEIQKKQLAEIEKNLWKQLKKSKVNDVVGKLNIALEKYIDTIKAEKIQIIESETKKMFDRLIRKQGFIQNFRIDNMIYLLDENNNQLNHSHLSAGEKQLFILSIIYAIIQTSERKVPMIFDTLLSRLDKEHRNNVLKEFIGSAPDQVIILSTDAELESADQTFLDSISNKAYLIDFSKHEQQITELR